MKVQHTIAIYIWIICWPLSIMLDVLCKDAPEIMKSLQPMKEGGLADYSFLGCLLKIPQLTFVENIFVKTPVDFIIYCLL